MKFNIQKYIPGQTQKKIESAHAKIIKLRKEKSTLLDDNPLSRLSYEVGQQSRKSVIEEEIKQQEEIIKMLSGRLDPSRNKVLWSIIVPLITSVVGTILVNKLSN